MSVRRCVLITALALSMLVPDINSQEHTKTPDECLADATAWSKQIDEVTLAALSYGELNIRQEEMANCVLADKKTVNPSSKKVGTEILIMGAYHHAMYRRQLDYLVRHKEFDNFLKEDDQGLR
jgi:hypothetical protein